MILRHSELNTHACSFVAPCGNAFEPCLSQLRRDWRGALMMGLSPPGWLLPAPWHTNTLSVTGGTAMGKAALPEAKKIVFFSQTLSHRHFCFCVDTHEKNHLQWQYPGFVNPAGNSRWVFVSPKRAWSSAIILTPKNQLVLAVGWIIQPAGHNTDPMKESPLDSSFILWEGSINHCLPLANVSAWGAHHFRSEDVCSQPQEIATAPDTCHSKCGDKLKPLNLASSQFAPCSQWIWSWKITPRYSLQQEINFQNLIYAVFGRFGCCEQATIPTPGSPKLFLVWTPCLWFYRPHNSLAQKAGIFLQSSLSATVILNNKYPSCLIYMDLNKWEILS